MATTQNNNALAVNEGIAHSKLTNPSAVSTNTSPAVNFIERASRMAERGVPIVPVQPQSKQCLLTGWQSKATTDAAQLRAWHAENSNYNTGCMASRDAGICMLDCDVLGLVKRIQDETGEKMPETFLVKSAGKGAAHLYFRHSDKSRALGNRKRADLFDFKADRSYVVGPDSVILKDGELRRYTLYKDADFAVIPDWLCAWIEANADGPKAPPKDAPETAHDFDIYAWLDHYDLHVVADEGDWIITDICPVAGRAHEQSVRTGFYFDGTHFGFHCFASGCPGSDMSIGQVIKHLNRPDGLKLRAPYPGPIWPNSDLPPAEKVTLIEMPMPGPATAALGATMALGNDEERSTVGKLLSMRSGKCDFVDDYTRCNDRLEAPAKLHEVIAISTIAAIANRNKVTFPYADRQHPMDLWLAALVQSGGGKNESLNVMRAMLDSTDVGKSLITGNRWGSPEFFFQDVSERSAHFWTWTELSELLGKLAGPRWGELKPWLTDRFDSPSTPPAIKHRTDGKGKTNTPDIVFNEAPRINVLGMSNIDWYMEKLQEADIRGGFLARFVPISLPATSKTVHFVPEPDPALWARLTRKLIDIMDVEGQADLSAVYSRDPGCLYARWYAETKARWNDKGDLAAVLFARWRVFVLKLAVIFELSSSSSLTVTVESFERAAQWLREQETVLFKVATTGGKDGLRLQRKLQWFRAAGKAGVPVSYYYRQYRNQPTWQKKADLDSLLQSREVIRVAQDGGKDKDAVLVYRGFVAGAN